MVRREAQRSVTEAILGRRSIRGFKPVAVSRGVLSEIMETALRAPSWKNIQPWEFAIVCGEKLEELRHAFADRLEATGQITPDFLLPERFTEPYLSRSRTSGAGVLQAKGIAREDKQGRAMFAAQGVRLFDAPAAIFVHIDRSVYMQVSGCSVYPLFDCGLVVQNIMLLATQYGLGTIPQIQGVLFPEIIREELGLPDNKLMVISIAVGYPDDTDPVNAFRSTRAPLSDLAKWYGW